MQHDYFTLNNKVNAKSHLLFFLLFHILAIYEFFAFVVFVISVILVKNVVVEVEVLLFEHKDNF